MCVYICIMQIVMQKKNRMFVSFMCLAALFSGLPTVQFVIRRPVQFYPVNDISVYLEREREGGRGGSLI